jgi:hypothetical protein
MRQLTTEEVLYGLIEGKTYHIDQINGSSHTGIFKCYQTLPIDSIQRAYMEGVGGCFYLQDIKTGEISKYQLERTWYAEGD